MVHSYAISFAMCFFLTRAQGLLPSIADGECPSDHNREEEHYFDLKHMFTLEKLDKAREGQNSPLFLPSLRALLHPYIELLVTKKIETTEFDPSKLRHFKASVNLAEKFIRASYGSLSVERVYSSNFEVAYSGGIHLKGSLVMTNLALHFVEYNATVVSGSYIGYNLNIKTDIEVLYTLSFYMNGTIAVYKLLQEVVGAGPITFSDRTNCPLVETRSDLNLGRLCGDQALKEITRWNSIAFNVLKFVTPVVSDVVHCSFKVVIQDLIEASASLALFLAQ